MNHRVATVAAKPSPIIPDATPRQIPILTNKCHFSKAKTVRNKLNKSKVMVTKIILVIPNFNISAPLNGLIEAKIKYIKAIAIEISQKSNYAGVILESPFTSISSMGKLKFPYLPIDFILNDKFDSINKTSNINIPSLVLHGKDDNLVPFYMGQEIFASLTYKSKSHFVDDDHMMRFDDQMIEAISRFVKYLD